MLDAHVDQALGELDTAVAVLHANYRAAQDLADRLDDECERSVEERPPDRNPPSRSPEPKWALLSVRRRLAEEAAEQHAKAVRAMAAWWVDAALIAVLSSGAAVMPDAARMAAADPSSWWGHEDLALLPPIPEFDRHLAELGLSLADGPPPSDDPDFLTFVADTRDYAASVGLAIRTTPDGKAVLVEDGLPEARRCRLWGRAWRDHELPLLPAAAELVDFVTQTGVSGDVIAKVRDASERLETVLTANARLAELDRQFSVGVLSESARLAAETELTGLLQDQAETIDCLVAYARALTTSLPAIRRACQPR